MQLIDLVPTLLVENGTLSVRFYTEELGFDVTDRQDEGEEILWAELRSGDARLAVKQVPPPIPPTAGTLLHVNVDDVRSAHEALRDRGVAASDLIVERYGLEEFQVTDPDGHVLVFQGRSPDATGPI